MKKKCRRMLCSIKFHKKTKMVAADMDISIIELTQKLGNLDMKKIIQENSTTEDDEKVNLF